MFVILRYEYTLNVLNEVQLHEEVEVGHVLYSWDKSHLQLGPPNREVPTLTPSIDAMKYKGEWWGVKQDTIRLHEIIMGMVVVAIELYPLTT